MTNFIKKLLTASAVFGMGSCGLAHADCNHECVEHQDLCVRGNWCDVIDVDLSLLYWKVSGDELDYAYDQRFVICNCATDSFKKRYHNVTSDYQPGFKLGLGLDFSCICWDADLVWTHFDSKNESHHNAGFRGSVVTSVAIPFIRGSGRVIEGNEQVVASGCLTFKYDVVDLEFGKWICCADCLQIRPYAGFRAANIREKFHAEVDRFNTATATDVPDNRAHIHNEFKGLGISAGLDSRWHLYGNFDILGRIGGAILWGNTKVRSDFIQFANVDAHDADYISHETDHYCHSRVFTDLSLGIAYNTCYCSYPVEIVAAWEHHYLFDQHRFFATDIASTEKGYNFKKDGDIALQGLTISASLEF